GKIRVLDGRITFALADGQQLRRGLIIAFIKRALFLEKFLEYFRFPRARAASSRDTENPGNLVFKVFTAVFEHSLAKLAGRFHDLRVVEQSQRLRSEERR